MAEKLFLVLPGILCCTRRTLLGLTEVSQVRFKQLTESGLNALHYYLVALANTT